MSKLAYSMLAVSVAMACGSGSDGDGSNVGSGGAASGGTSNGTGGTIDVSMGGSDGSLPGEGDYELPSDFTKAQRGGFKLGDPVMANDPGTQMGEGGGNGSGGCGNTLTGVVRDFNAAPGGHPDFEMDLAEYGLFTGIVQNNLGADKKPVYAPNGATGYTTGASAFDQWYRTTQGVNQAFKLTLFLVPGDGGVFTFESNAFFPVDGAGFGNENRDHNFHFTFELHTEFQYNGGEEFTFIGDDDVFVFINGKLAVDLGGVHPMQTGSIVLDDRTTELGIQLGSTYALDMFHAERHTTQSNFRVDTTLQFTNCGVFVPDVPK